MLSLDLTAQRFARNWKTISAVPLVALFVSPIWLLVLLPLLLVPRDRLEKQKRGKLKSLRNFGFKILSVGITIGVTLWLSRFSEYMFLEDRGLETSEAGIAALKANPGERFLLVVSVALVIGGMLVVVISYFQGKRNHDNTQ
jgi:hypothetical protein